MWPQCPCWLVLCFFLLFFGDPAIFCLLTPSDAAVINRHTPQHKRRRGEQMSLTTSAKGKSSENLAMHIHSKRLTNKPLLSQEKVTTICACDLAPKHSQAALQLLLIYNLWKIKALQCGRSRQPRSLHPSSLTFRGGRTNTGRTSLLVISIFVN